MRSNRPARASALPEEPQPTRASPPSANPPSGSERYPGRCVKVWELECGDAVISRRCEHHGHDLWPSLAMDNL